MLEIAIIRSTVETWGIIFDKCCQSMAYADEVVIRGRLLQDVKEVITCCIFSFGWFLGVWILCADILEHCPIFVGHANKNYITGRTNKYDGIRNKWKKDKIYHSITKALQWKWICKFGTYNFAIVKDYTCFHTILTNKNESRPEIEKGLQMHLEHIIHFFLY